MEKRTERTGTPPAAIPHSYARKYIIHAYQSREQQHPTEERLRPLRFGVLRSGRPLARSCVNPGTRETNNGSSLEKINRTESSATIIKQKKRGAALKADRFG